MREVIVRFEIPPGFPDLPEAQDGAVCGSISLPGDSGRPPIRFDGWLQLLGLLEDIYAMTDESPEPPRPLPRAGHHQHHVRKGAGNVIRWLYLFKYPEGVRKEEGERWYLGTHCREARQMADHGMMGYRTWNGLKSPYADPYQSAERLNEWDRVTELVFPDFEAFREATTVNAVAYTPPPYGGGGFLAHTIFIAEQPQYDFLRELPDVR